MIRFLIFSFHRHLTEKLPVKKFIAVKVKTINHNDFFFCRKLGGFFKTANMFAVKRVKKIINIGRGNAVGYFL